MDPGDGGPVSVWSAPSPLEVPSIRARREGGRLVVSADGPVSHWQAESGLDQALRTWAERIAEGHAPPAVPAVPPMWCSWYGYWDKVTEADVVDNLHLAARLGIPADMFLLDDGYEAEIGDWLETRQGFGSLERTVGTIREAGKRAGIWVAPSWSGTGAACSTSTPSGWSATPGRATCGTRTSPCSTSRIPGRPSTSSRCSPPCALSGSPTSSSTTATPGRSPGGARRTWTPSPPTGAGWS
ncbi:alpha-galactosidase [Thermocatellispora tengchongensis]|uniref:hypothetical protein n=1 Tax=Thermocatellispora tengchongensis TaxID=1073253 RepID=UPI003629B6FF